MFGKDLSLEAIRINWLGCWPKHLQVLPVFIMYDSGSITFCTFLNIETSKHNPWTDTNHQSVMKISSSAFSIAFATSSKYPLALTYLKNKFVCLFIYLSITKTKHKKKTHILWQSQSWKPLPRVSTQPPVYLV